MPKKRPLFILSLVFLLLLTAACGKKGDPVPKGKPFPSRITDLNGEVRDGVLFLSFSVPTRNQDGSPVTGLAGFRIEKVCGTCVGGFEPFRDVRLADTRGYTVDRGRLYVYDSELRPGFEYIYRVTPYLETGIYGDPSNLFSLKWQTPPEPPRGVKAVSGDGFIQLSWSTRDDELYNVYRFQGDIYPLFPLNESPLRAGTFIDQGLRNGTAYRYEVRSVRGEGNVRREGEGAAVSATPVDKTSPEPPRDLTATRKNATVSLSWTPSPDGDVAGYIVYRIENGRTVKLTPSPVKETIFLDARPGEERYVSYTVTAIDHAGNESEPSREAIIILKE